MSRPSLANRTIAVAEDLLAEKHYVAPIDVLLGLRWLTPPAIDTWRKRRVDNLERLAQVDAEKLDQVIVHLADWAMSRDLKPIESDYLAPGRQKKQLLFTSTGEETIERVYRTHWFSRELTSTEATKIIEKTSKPPDLVVVSPLKEWSCHSCGGSGEWLTMEDPGPLCMTCAEMDHLVFLPSGNTALTRRSRKHSRLAAVVVEWSRSRGRYERQGLLVEEKALQRAEEECLADEDARAQQRERAAARRSDEDQDQRQRMTAEILRLFPGCPPERAEVIAGHATVRSSGRVGRSAAGRNLDPQAIHLAVVASVRHLDTNYDDLLMQGVDRHDARIRVDDELQEVLDTWRNH